VQNKSKGGTIKLTTEHGSLDMATLKGANVNINGSHVQWDVMANDFQEVHPTRSEIDILKDDVKAMKEQIILIDRDNCLEADYQELKDAYDAYEELRDKLRTFKALKDSA